MIAPAAPDARQGHRALLQALREHERAERNVVLRFAELHQRQWFRGLGYASVYHYAREELGFSDSRTAQLVRLSKDVQRLPRLKQAIQDEKIPWTAARTVGRVATPENEAEWVERAQRTSRRQLERDAKRKRRPQPAAQTSLVPSDALPAGDPPVWFGFQLTAEEAARAQRLMERNGQDRKTLFLAALDALEGKRAETAPVQLMAYRCEACEGVGVPTPSGMRRLSPLRAETASCDAEVVDREGRKRSRIPPRLRRQVLARDGHRCVRCGRTGFLHIHHRRRQADGGAHTLENCVTVCGPCHRLHHAEEEVLGIGHDSG